MIDRRRFLSHVAMAGCSLVSMPAQAKLAAGSFTTPPFVKNRDNNHCLQCCVLMILRALGHDVSPSTVDELTAYDGRYYSWNIMGAAALGKYAEGVRFYSGLDYSRIADEGEAYLKDTWRRDWYAIQKAHNDKGFERARTAARAFLSHGTVTTDDHPLDSALALTKDHFVVPIVSYGKLYNTSVKASHSILLYKADDTSIWFHDPGLPPRPAQRVSRQHFAEVYESDCDLIVVPKNTISTTRDISHITKAA